MYVHTANLHTSHPAASNIYLRHINVETTKQQKWTHCVIVHKKGNKKPTCKQIICHTKCTIDNT